MGKKLIKMDPGDTVATALADIQKGEEVEIVESDLSAAKVMTAGEDIPYGNKIALTAIPQGAGVVKYGEVIGTAIRGIAPGRLVHVHNVRSLNLDIPPAIVREIIKTMGIEEET